MSQLQTAALLAAIALAGTPVQACEVPADGGNTPWHRMVTKVKYLPETEAWAKRMSRERNVVQYIVSLGEPRRLGGRCYWPVEVRAEGKLWKRFLVTPQGDALREDQAPALN